MKKVALLLLVVAIIGGVVFLILRPSKQTGPGIRVSGTIEATTVELSFKAPGRVVQRFVDEGDRVTAGQVIARLESDDLAREVAARRAERDAQMAVLAELEAGYRKEDIAQAQAALDRVRAEETRLRDDFSRQKNLYEREVIPRQAFDASRAAFDAAQAAAREAEQRLKLLRAGPRPETIDQARAKVKATEQVLALAETRLGYTILTAPQAGSVLAKNTEPGEHVAPGTPIVTIANLENVWVRAYISETDLGRVKLGQKAEVTSDTWKGKTYPGRVTYISPEAEFTPKTVQTEKERVKLVYRIKITLPNLQQELKPGMPVDAVVDTVN
jgi:HlyD family secretion protein